MRIIPTRDIRTLTFAALMLALASTVRAQDAEPKRPKITGISHGNYYVSDLPKAIAFWHEFLGYDESYDLTKPDGKEIRIAFIKVNDHQHIELDNEPPTHPPNMMSHLCFTVDDIEAMRSYLRSKGFDVKPGDGSKNRTGDYSFQIRDPDGTGVEFVQSLPDGLEAKAAGKFMPATRIADRIDHLGFLVGSSERSIDFYANVLGFKETGRGGTNPDELSWINMRVPDGDDYVELMFDRKLPADLLGTTNHISLVVPDVAKAITILESRPAFKTYAKDLTVATGINQKRRIDIYDPDGTRVELLEPSTATNKPAPSSTAPSSIHD